MPPYSKPDDFSDQPTSSSINAEKVSASLDSPIVESYDESMPEIVSSTSSFGLSADTRSQSSIVYGNDLNQVDKDLIFEGLKKLYQKKVLPLELASKYSHFGSPPLSPSDFEAKPMVLIMGQVIHYIAICFISTLRYYFLSQISWL